jgi:hypothetical protein
MASGLPLSENLAVFLLNKFAGKLDVISQYMVILNLYEGRAGFHES